MVTPENQPNRVEDDQLEELKKAETEFIAFATQFLEKFPSSDERWFGGDDNFFYFKVEHRSASETSIKLMNLREQRIPSSSTENPLGDLDNSDIVFKLNLVFRNNAINFILFTGEPLSSGRINTRILSFPVEEGKLELLAEIIPKLKEIMATFSELTQEKS